jgi:hypothetical protein
MKLINLDNIPMAPHAFYKNKGWTSYGDWLGTGVVQLNLRKYRSYEKSKKFAISLNLKSRRYWIKYCKEIGLPYDIPRKVEEVYKNKGWTSWGDFLGTGNISDNLKMFNNFKKSREFVRSLKLKNKKEWYKYCKKEKPTNTPVQASRSYKNNGWTNWNDFLGH